MASFVSKGKQEVGYNGIVDVSTCIPLIEETASSTL